jgi:hypothetical protein
MKLFFIYTRPDWTERSWLDKTADGLSFGIRPLLRNMFSKEKVMEKSVEDLINPNYHNPSS